MRHGRHLSHGAGSTAPRGAARWPAGKPVALHVPADAIDRYNVTMARTITIQLPDESREALEELGRRQHRSAEDVAEDILQRYLAVSRWRKNRDRLQPRAEAAGFHGEDDVIDGIS